MKNFNHYAGREEFSAFKDFFLTHGQCKEMKKKEYFTLQGALATHGAYIEEGLFDISVQTTEDTSILSVILLPESM